jgi:hypothetical protein
MGVTRLFISTSKSDADQTAAFWTHLPDGYTVHALGPTAKVKVEKANPDEILWQSDGSAPWYGVLVTKPDTAGDQPPAAAAGDDG